MSLTIHQVASRAGVSSATITRVLQGDRRVAPETRARVQAVLDETGYHVNAIAKSLRTKKVATVAHILNSFLPNPFYSNVARGLQQEAASFAYEVLVYNAENSATVERDAVLAAIRRRVDAIIFTTALEAENVQLATSAGVRVVQVERPTEVKSPVVTVNNYIGAYEAAEYLISLGHRDIAFIGLEASGLQKGKFIEEQRQQGYLDALANAGLEPEVQLGERYNLRDVADFQAPGREYAQLVLARQPRPTAIFAASDLLAAGVLQALYGDRLRVPEEISVVGFDDTYAAALTPRLTTVEVPMQELGRAAFKCAVVEPLRDEVELTTKLVVRDSTAHLAIASGVATSANGRRKRVLSAPRSSLLAVPERQR